MRKEAALMAQFDHPNIVGLLGVITRGGDCKIVLQICDKGSLKGLLSKDKMNEGEQYLPHRVALHITRDVTCGMAYLEEKHFVHRDIAARNVLVMADDTCQVADFGMSRAMNDVE